MWKFYLHKTEQKFCKMLSSRFLIKGFICLLDGKSGVYILGKKVSSVVLFWEFLAENQMDSTMQILAHACTGAFCFFYKDFAKLSPFDGNKHIWISITFCFISTSMNESCKYQATKYNQRNHCILESWNLEIFYRCHAFVWG